MAARPEVLGQGSQAVNLNRKYSINQIEYCRNFIFKRNFPIHKIFEHSCEMGLFRLAADKVAYIFGVRVTKRLRGKLHSVLEKLDHGHHVLRIYCKNLVGRMYEKFSTFLRVEVCVNRMKDLGLNKGLENLERLRQKLVAITDRFAGFEAQSLNVHVDFPLFQRIALPVTAGKTKIAGIKIHDTRMMRLMEVLLHGGTQLNGWRSADIHQAILTTFGLSADSYTLTQLRYDLRKMKAHGLVERIGRTLPSTASLTKAPKPHSCSSCSTSASAAHWRTRCSITVPTNLSSPPARSKPPTTRPIVPSNKFSTCSPRS